MIDTTLFQDPSDFFRVEAFPMLLGEPARTDWDWNFQLLGIRTRIHPLFWAIAALLGIQAVKQNFVWLLLWISAVFISIVVHELGHALCFRYYRINSHIVLYHFGGLAIPDSFQAAGYGSQLKSGQQLAISAAGPAAQLALALVVILLLRLTGYSDGFVSIFIPPHWTADPLVFVPSEELRRFIFYLVEVSIFWALLNLMPVYPLDGGQIARELFLLGGSRQAIPHSLILSIVVAVGIALWGFQRQESFMGIMFLMLAYSSYMTLQQYTGRGGFGGGGRW